LCVLAAAPFLGTRCALPAELRDAAATWGDEVDGAAVESMGAPPDPLEATSADAVGTGPTENEWNSTTGASATGNGAAVTLGIGDASFCETEVEWDGTVNASVPELLETSDREAPASLDLSAYRTTATPAAVPRSAVRICS
jgi:hypothetical protein